ncbi:MAG: TonB family protein [Symploca sp. SIO1C4]|uniref:TonB family protein n=1 Tax=Symploca sp. SIO1C4 TaxID=2607765 RepID=A0A6B3N2T0_9CYAN|nr:TonB family protein [Symploca sp. SIO1C4]
MSISSFCIEQRELEQEALKKFLAISLVGSAVLHVALAFSINWLAKEPEFVNEPIEIILVEEPEPPPAQPKEEKLESPPIPEPPPVKPPQIQELIETKIAEAPQPLPPTPVTPQKPVAPKPPPVVSKPIETSRQPQPKIKTPNQPDFTPNETAPISPPKAIAANQSVPSRPNHNSQPLSTPSDVERKLSQSLNSSTNSPVTPSTDISPTAPGEVAVNQSAPPRPNHNSQPLSTPSDVERKLSQSLNSSTNSSVTQSTDASPTAPGEVAVNRSVPTKPAMASSSLAPSSADSRQFSDFSGSDSSSVSPGGSEEQGSPTSPGEVVAAGSAPAKPEIREGGGGLLCVRRCNPKYPSSLNGEEGTTIVRVVVDQNGNVVETEVARNSGNSQVDQEALTAAKKMRFSAPAGGGLVAVRVNINFTVEGSEFDRQARERQEQMERERLAREREQAQEEARQRKIRQQQEQEAREQAESEEELPQPTAVE